MSHFGSREPDEFQTAEIKKIKDAGDVFHAILEGLTPSRERSLAITNLEQAVFWAVRGIAIQNG